MNLDHLQYFLSVTRTGGFTQAARQLHVTQPTISSAVSGLEQDLGVRLFHRGRRIELTTEGRALLEYAVQVEGLLEEVRERIGVQEPQPGDSFRFGAVDAAVIYLLPEVLRDYARTNPGVEISIQVAPSRLLVEDLMANRSEFAVINLPLEHSRLETLSILKDEMPLVVAADHSFARRRTVQPHQVAGESLILFPAESVSRTIVNQRFAEANVTPRVVMEMGSPEAMRKLVEVGAGISFLPRLSVAESLQSGTLREVKVRGMKFYREIGLAWRQGRYLGPAVRRLVEEFLDGYGLANSWRERTRLDPS
ncbi:MAG: LysR family transcriptional regulator [Candidatus Latescibacterota bacterium]|nr:LysR family transcriptional regulator [Candidatus Latescibacterota bacterium]